ncbi:hypothetical protein AAFO92_17165 [Roseovarius sp. CAU 1744]|uniref:hypothetical protein n=1 Tax=Roseovarius sp. CAU 1744 TaxID=3140368 RepID=UPI00325ACFFC
MTLLDERAGDVSDITAEEVMASHFTLVSQPGAIEAIAVDGVEGWTSPNPHPALSLICWTTDDPGEAAAALERVTERFRTEGRGFDWMTCPRCDHSGLVSLLEDQGFINPPLQIAAMVKRIEPHGKPQPPDGVHIWKVDEIADKRIWCVMAQGFDVPDDVAEIFHNAYANPSKLQRTEIYAAAVDGSDTPVGVGYLSYIGDGPSVLLRVSCTLEGNRGRGIYSAVVKRRLHDAARAGRTQAFVHAYSEESRRCLEHLGFSCVGTLQLHRWRP